MTTKEVEAFMYESIFEEIERRRLMATLDQELNAMNRYLVEAACDMSGLGPRDPHFYEEFSRKVDAVIYELATARARIRTLLPAEVDEMPNTVQEKVS